MGEKRFVDKNQFTEDILKILERGSANDVKITLSDGEISANKDILMARSEYFATMLSNNKFVEGDTSSVDMSHCSMVVMEKIIKFLFSGEVTFDQMSLENLLELTHMADMMLLTKFKVKVEDFVKAKIASNDDEETAELVPELVSGLRLAIQYNLSNSKQTIINELYYALMEIPENVKASDSFKCLSFDLIKDIFLFDQELYEFAVYPSSSHKLNSFVAWLSANEVTEEQKKEIVGSFDFEDFTVEELLTSVRDSGLYSVKKIDERLLDLFKEQKETIENVRRGKIMRKLI